MAEDVSRRRLLKRLEKEGDRVESLEDFLQWTNEVPLEPEEVFEARRRDSLPSFPPGPFQPSRTSSRSIRRPQNTTTASSHENQQQNHRPTDTPTQVTIPLVPMRTITTAVRGGIRKTSHNLRRVSNVKVSPFQLQPKKQLRLHRSNSLPNHRAPWLNPTTTSRRILHPRNKYPNEATLIASEQDSFTHVQPHTRTRTFPHISDWARTIRRSSSAGLLAPQSQSHSPASDFDDIEPIDDDVSSRASGALDMLTAEEYLRQTAFDEVDEGRLWMEDGRRASFGHGGDNDSYFRAQRRKESEREGKKGRKPGEWGRRRGSTPPDGVEREEWSWGHQDSASWRVARRRSEEEWKRVREVVREDDVPEEDDFIPDEPTAEDDDDDGNVSMPGAWEDHRDNGDTGGTGDDEEIQVQSGMMWHQNPYHGWGE